MTHDIMHDLKVVLSIYSLVHVSCPRLVLFLSRSKLNLHWKVFEQNCWNCTYLIAYSSKTGRNIQQVKLAQSCIREKIVDWVDVKKMEMVWILRDLPLFSQCSSYTKASGDWRVMFWFPNLLFFWISSFHLSKKKQLLS